MKSTRGFTLIELLVVIAIIGILSATVLVSLNTARTKAADAARLSSIKQIERALELYYNDNGRYPQFTYAVSPYLSAGTYNPCGLDNDWCDLETALSAYLKTLPKDSSLDRRYVYKSNPPYDTYGLQVILERPHQAAASDGGYYVNSFEIGGLPGYCKSKYTGASADWMNWDGNNKCAGGN